MASSELNKKNLTFVEKKLLLNAHRLLLRAACRFDDWRRPATIFAPRGPHLWTPLGNSDVKTVVAAYFLVGGRPVSVVGLEEALTLLRYNEIHYHRRTTGDGRLGALIEVVHRSRAHELEFEVRVRVDTSGHHVFPTRIDRPSPSGNNQVASQLPVNNKKKNINTLNKLT